MVQRRHLIALRQSLNLLVIASLLVLSMGLAPVQAAGNVLVPILAYHYLAPAANPPPDTSYYVTAEEFANQLDVIQVLGYTTVGLDDLVNYRNDPTGHPLPAKPVVITFDDGQQGIYQYAFPALQARGMKATFFLITDYIGTSDANRCVDVNWDGNPSCQVIWPEVIEMYQGGMEIGSHSRTHPGNLIDLYNDPAPLPYSAQEEISGSKTAIESHLGNGTARFFAYPHGIGAGDTNIETLVANAGYQAAVGYDPVNFDVPANPLTDGIFHFPRLNVDFITNEILDTNNPYYFFPTRLDPNFPYPDLYPPDQNVTVTDSSNIERTQYYPGESVKVAVTPSNYGAAANVSSRLKLANTNYVNYDSHPANDQLATPLPIGYQVYTFAYDWVIPATDQAIGAYPYQFITSDPSGLLQYYNYNSAAAAFTVIKKPVSVTASSDASPALPQWPKDTRTLTFTVTVEPGSSAQDIYLSVSLSSHLTVTGSTAAVGQWNNYLPGSTIGKKDGSTISSPYLLYELQASTVAAGTYTFTLTVKGLPYVTSSDWIKYRLSAKMNQPILTDDTFLRDPINSSTTDQQDFYAFQLDVVDPNFQQPYLDTNGAQAVDSTSLPRSQFYPGEPVQVTVPVSNWGKAEDVSARLNYSNGQVGYDSHPTEDQFVTPFPYGLLSHTFAYDWTIPVSDQAIGLYPYQFTATDLTGTTQYYQFDSATASAPAAFAVVKKPISVLISSGSLPQWPKDIRTITFTVTVDPGSSAQDVYLSASFSNRLTVIGSTASNGQWTAYEIGGIIGKKDGSSMTSQYLLYDMQASNVGPGTYTYTLTVKGLPYVNAQDWMKFRLSAKMDQPILTHDSFLRDPLSGPTDQQDFYAFQLNVADPNFQQPYLDSEGAQAVDSSGHPRTQFYPGEPVRVNVPVSNWGKEGDISAQLNFSNGQVGYDSHPDNDQSAMPAPYGLNTHTFSYDWTIPASAQAIGQYPYLFTATDLTGATQYYQLDSTAASAPAALEVVAKPISVSMSSTKLPVIPNQVVTLTFTIHIDPPQTATQTFLSVSLSEHLVVVDSSTPQGAWTQHDIGSDIVKKDGTILPAPFLLWEMQDDNYGSGTQTYTLKVKALEGISAQDWVKYRLSAKMNQPILTSDTYLRDPLSGQSDQQEYYTFHVSGSEPERIMLPVVYR